MNYENIKIAWANPSRFETPPAAAPQHEGFSDNALILKSGPTGRVSKDQG